jgi:hypothetical protein
MCNDTGIWWKIIIGLTVQETYQQPQKNVLLGNINLYTETLLYCKITPSGKKNVPVLFINKFV